MIAKSTQSNSTVVVYDPIPFHGGSKIATATMLKQLTEEQGEALQIQVISADPDSWSTEFMVSHLTLPAGLAKQTQKLGYWFKQLYLTVILLTFCVRVAWQQRSLSLKVVLASGPAVDMAGYWVSLLTPFSAIQLIHGPVAQSRVAKWAVRQKLPTFYLSSQQQNLEQLFSPFKQLPSNFVAFENGLSSTQWPTERTSNFEQPLSLFWAASLLKWKGLPLLEQALERIKAQPFTTTICYIQPRNTTAECAALPKNLEACRCYESPTHLDQLRADSHVFISTSHNEPFGLSILEALATGLIVVIPSDGAYWDKQLVNGVNCFKYRSNDAKSLAETLRLIDQHRAALEPIANAAKAMANHYRAKHCYQLIVTALAFEASPTHSATTSKV